MAGLSSKVKAYAAANGVADVDFSNDVKLQDNSDGKGAFIAEWNLAISKPTDAQPRTQDSTGRTGWNPNKLQQRRQKKNNNRLLKMFKSFRGCPLHR